MTRSAGATGSIAKSDERAEESDQPRGGASLTSFMLREIIVIGTSFGGLGALETVLPALPRDLDLPVVVVQHRTRDTNHDLCAHLERRCALPVVEPNDKDEVRPGCIYLAPRNYHLLVEEHGGERGFALSIDAPVMSARPSVDVLFESAADVYGAHTIGVILTGTNRDGAAGLRAIKRRGGYAIVEDPQTAAAASMPDAALRSVAPDRVLPLGRIAPHLVELCRPHTVKIHAHGRTTR